MNNQTIEEEKLYSFEVILHPLIDADPRFAAKKYLYSTSDSFSRIIEVEWNTNLKETIDRAINRAILLLDASDLVWKSKNLRVEVKTLLGEILHSDKVLYIGQWKQ